MLLEALVACAGVTLNAVATALQLTVRDARIRAEGDLDFRGTLGVAKDAPVGFRDIRLTFEIDGDLISDQNSAGFPIPRQSEIFSADDGARRCARKWPNGHSIRGGGREIERQTKRLTAPPEP